MRIVYRQDYPEMNQSLKLVFSLKVNSSISNNSLGGKVDTSVPAVLQLQVLHYR